MVEEAFALFDKATKSWVNSIRWGKEIKSPQVERKLGEIGSLLNSVIATGQVTGSKLIFEISDEAKKILDEAATIAERRIKDKYKR